MVSRVEVRKLALLWNIQQKYQTRDSEETIESIYARSQIYNLQSGFCADADVTITQAWAIIVTDFTPAFVQ